MSREMFLAYVCITPDAERESEIENQNFQKSKFAKNKKIETAFFSIFDRKNFKFGMETFRTERLQMPTILFDWMDFAKVRAKQIFRQLIRSGFSRMPSS
jgi:hypothetical protein